MGWFINRSSKKPDKALEVVQCSNCGVIVAKTNAKSVKRYDLSSVDIHFYCQIHAPKYDEIYYNPYESFSTAFSYVSKWMLVDRNGIPIGYTRTK